MTQPSGVAEVLEQLAKLDDDTDRCNYLADNSRALAVLQSNLNEVPAGDVWIVQAAHHQAQLRANYDVEIQADMRVVRRREVGEPFVSFAEVPGWDPHADPDAGDLSAPAPFGAAAPAPTPIDSERVVNDGGDEFVSRATVRAWNAEALAATPPDAEPASACACVGDCTCVIL